MNELFRVKQYGLSSVKKNEVFRVKQYGLSSLSKSERGVRRTEACSSRAKARGPN